MAAKFGPDGFTVPTGTTADRPSSPSTGSFRYNTDLSSYEVYDASISTWILVDPSSAF